MMVFDILKLKDCDKGKLTKSRHKKVFWKGTKMNRSLEKRFLESFNLTRVKICFKKQNIKIQLLITINRNAFSSFRKNGADSVYPRTVCNPATCQFLMYQQHQEYQHQRLCDSTSGPLSLCWECEEFALLFVFHQGLYETVTSISFITLQCTGRFSS